MRNFVEFQILIVLVLVLMTGCDGPASDQTLQSGEQKYSDIGAPICEAPLLRAEKSVLVTVSGGQETNTAFVTDWGGQVPAEHFTVNVSEVNDNFNLILYNTGRPAMFDIIGQSENISQIISYGSSQYGPEYFAVKGGEGKSRIVEVAIPPDPAETEDMIPQHARRADSACNPRHYFYDAKDLTVLAATGEEYPNGFPYLDFAIDATAAVEASISQHEGRFSVEIVREDSSSVQELPQSAYGYFLAMREATVKIEETEWLSFRQLALIDDFSGWGRLQELSRLGEGWLNTSTDFDERLAAFKNSIDFPLLRIDSILIDSEETPVKFPPMFIGNDRIFPTILLLPNSEGSFSTDVGATLTPGPCFINSRTGELSQSCKLDARG